MPKQMKDFHSNKDGLGKIASKRVNFLRTEGGAVFQGWGLALCLLSSQTANLTP